MRRRALLTAGILVAACRDREREPPAPAPSASALERGEDSSLVAGTLEVFGLVLPLGAAIVRRSGQSVVARVPASLERATAYVRARLREGRLVVSSTRVESDKVRFGGPTAIKDTLRVVLVRELQATSLTLRRNLDA